MCSRLRCLYNEGPWLDRTLVGKNFNHLLFECTTRSNIHHLIANNFCILGKEALSVETSGAHLNGEHVIDTTLSRVQVPVVAVKPVPVRSDRRDTVQSTTRAPVPPAVKLFRDETPGVRFHLLVEPSHNTLRSALCHKKLSCLYSRTGPRSL